MVTMSISRSHHTSQYDPYTRGVELWVPSNPIVCADTDATQDVWTKNPDGSEYIGLFWPKYTVRRSL